MLRKFLVVMTVVMVMTVVTAGGAWAAPVGGPMGRQSPIVNELFPEAFVKAGLGMVLLIVIDLLLGVAVALKLRQFDLARLADFYRTRVVPNLLGWATLDVLLRVAASYQLPVVEALQPVGSAALYGVVLAALLGQIASKYAQLRDEVPAASA